MWLSSAGGFRRPAVTQLRPDGAVAEPAPLAPKSAKAAGLGGIGHRAACLSSPPLPLPIQAILILGSWDREWTGPARDSYPPFVVVGQQLLAPTSRTHSGCSGPW